MFFIIHKSFSVGILYMACINLKIFDIRNLCKSKIAYIFKLVSYVGKLMLISVV